MKTRIGCSQPGICTPRYFSFASWQLMLMNGLLLLVIGLLSSCQKFSTDLIQEGKGESKHNGNAYGQYLPDMVIAWNQAAISTVVETQALVPNPPIPPFVESRFYAMVNLAMHDALNAIVPKYRTYALDGVRENKADPDIAVAQAAHDVIVALYGSLNPPAFVTPQPVRDNIAALLQQSLSKQVSPDARAKGIALGKLAAEAIIQKRNNDGAASAMFPVTEGSTPGAYRFTFPFNGPPFNTPPFAGLYDAPGWGQVKPFGIQTGDQFRPGPPDPVTSAAYTADFDEVKSLGKFNSILRSGEQTTIAKFWAESSPQGWNRVAITVMGQRNFNAWQAARLLSLLQMAEADAYIGCIEAKFHYFYWRPVSAIRLADGDENPATIADPDWDVLGWNPAGPPDTRFWPTPPVADYPSAHSTAGGAGAEILRQFFGKDDIRFSLTSTTDPAVRTFNSFSSAARENALSRIYIGFHFRKACIEGEAQGKNIGQWVYQHHLKEN